MSIPSSFAISFSLISCAASWASLSTDKINTGPSRGFGRSVYILHIFINFSQPSYDLLFENKGGLLLLAVAIFCDGWELTNSVIFKSFQTCPSYFYSRVGILFFPAAIVRIRIFSTYKAILTDSLVGS